MASVKGRVKAPKSASTGRGRVKPKILKTDLQNATDSPNETKNTVVTRRFTALQKVLMQNKPIDFNKCTDKILKLNAPPSKVSLQRLRRKQKKEQELKRKQQLLDKIPKFVSKSGRIIGSRSKVGSKMIDDILKKELMIEIVNTSCNNNEDGISDQNSMDVLSMDEPSIDEPIIQIQNENKKIPKLKAQIKKSTKNKKKPDTKITDISKSALNEVAVKKSHLNHQKPSGNRYYAPKNKPLPRQTLDQETIIEATTKATAIKYKIIENHKPKEIKTKVTSGKRNDQNVKTKQVTLSNGLVLTLALFQCDHCPQKMFSSKASLRRHMYTHLNLEPHRCKKCTKKFRFKMHLHTHMNRYHKEIKKLEPLLCQICDKAFLLEENLNLHLNTHIKNENAFKCVFCEKQFSYHLLLTQHEKQHLLTGEYQCPVCKMSFECRNRLKFHMKSHLKIKDYICQHCGKEFLRMNSLRRHVQICHSGHRLQCPVCKKKLKGHLTEHMRTHKQARPHECKLCGARFTQSTQLTVHLRSHTGERPFPCRICNAAFTHSNALMLHIRRHTGEKPFQCAVCPLSFAQLNHMKTHLLKIHNMDSPYKCPKCNNYFKLKKEMEAHVKGCKVGDRELTFEEKIQESVRHEEVVVETPMTLSRMRYLMALLLKMVANESRLKFLGFNKRPIEELLLESIEAAEQTPCKDKSLTPIARFKTNIQIFLDGYIPRNQMEKFEKEHKTTEEILEILTDDKKKDG